MAGFNEILAGRYNRALQKLFSIKGPAPVPALAGEIAPVHPLYNGVENRWLEGWDRFGTVVNITGAAGQFAAMRLRNPAGSKLMAVLESILISGVAAFYNFSLGATSLDLTTGFVASRLDARSLRKSALILTDQTTLAVAVAATTLQAIVPANTTFQIISNENQELTLAPGDGIDIGVASAAVQMIVAAIWRERVLEDSEVTLS